MVDEINDFGYLSPFYFLKSTKKEYEKKEESGGILWWIFFIFSLILLALYMLGAYFVYFDDAEDFKI